MSDAEPDQVKPNKPKRLFMKQANMMRMLYALVPVLAAGVYLFGWRVLALVVVCTLVGLITEGITAGQRGQPISTACFVTCWLYALSLPPTMPFWMAAVGVVVGVLFGKEVFGGFGRNFANPAVVGRAFVYVCFPIASTGRFVPALWRWPGALARWSFATMGELPAWLNPGAKLALADAVTAATPMWARRDFGFDTPLADLFIGTIGRTFQGPYGTRVLAAGSIGEVSAMLCILAGVYLLATRTANYRLMLSPLLGAVGMAVVLRHVAGVDAVPPLGFTMCSGALLYGSVFMVTEPVSAPKQAGAMWLYGLFIGVMIVVLRWKSQFSGAVAFAILLGNIVGPLLDMGVGALRERRKAGAAGDAGDGT